MGKDHLLVLKTDDELRRSSKDILDFLHKTSKLRFWRTHFANHNFVFEPEKFDWQYWQTIPFLTIHDLIRIGIEPRLNDAKPLIQEYTHRLLLRIVYRKTKQQHILYVDAIPKSKLLTMGGDKGWKIQLSESFGLNLRHTLLSLRSTHNKSHLIILTLRLDQRLKMTFDGLKFNTLSIDPRDLPTFIDIFVDSKIVKQIKKVHLARSFRDFEQEQHTKEIISNAEFVVQTPLVEITTAIRPCLFAQKRFGSNAVHPRRHAIIELINIDESGYGEVVVTIMLPLELAWIRYRTGIFGKAIFEECECGSKWSLILERIRKFHYSLPVENIPS